MHFDFNYVNAFWDGQRMTYGDGNGSSITPLTTVDIIGHEIAHAVTQYSADLIYQYESGALNESFSDIFGQSIEFEAVPETANWNLGDEIFTNGADMIRSMSAPNSQGQPDTYLGDMWFEGSDDNGGVHYNSGVQNFWFYLLVEGGTGTNDFGEGYQVPAIGLEKAQQIAFRNLFFYLNQNSQYIDARFGSEMAAIDLYGENSPEYQAVRAAWDAVGVPSMDPEIEVADDIDFGKAVLAETTLTIPIKNNGLANLNISDLSIDNNDFSLPETPIEITENETFDLELDYNPVSLGVHTAILTISNNDTDKQISLTIEVVEDPVYSVSTEQFNVELLAGESQSEEVIIQNDNDYDLTFGIETEANVSTSASYMPTGNEIKVGKLSLPLFKKLAKRSSSDEDSIAGGYSWTDAVSYNWYDIQSVGTEVTLSDDSNSGLVSLGFTFPFFEETFDQVSIGSNGWISFTNSSGSIWNNPLPSSSAPENVVAIMASDLHPDAGSAHYYYDETNGRFIIQYTEWSSYSDRSASFDMQIHLYDNGKIKLLYDKISGARASAVGIQDGNREQGLTVAYDNQDFFAEGYAVEIGKGNSIGDWLTVSEASILVPANGSASFTTEINSEGLFGGDYQSDIILNLEEFQSPNDRINIYLTVIGSPNLEEVEFDLGRFFVNEIVVKEYYLTNIGNETLDISNLALENANSGISFSLSDSSIAPYDSALLSFELSMNQAGAISNALLVTSNDSENEITSLPISGEVLDPPVVNLDQASLSSNLLSGESEQQSVTISNTGSSDLIVEIQKDNFNYQGSTTGRSSIDQVTFNDINANKYSALKQPEPVIANRQIVARSEGNIGRVFTMNAGDTTIYELDPESGDIVNTINTGFVSEGPEGLAFDGENLYYNYWYTNQYVYKVDANTGQRLDSVLISSEIGIDGLAHSGSTLVASSFNQAVIYEIDFETDQLQPIIDNFPVIGGFSFGGDRNSIFVATDNVITEIDYETRQELQSHTFNFTVYGIGYSNASGKLFASNLSTNEILMVDPDDWSYETFTTGFGSFAMAADETTNVGSTAWLTTSFDSDTIPAGTSRALEVSFNADNLLGGTYSADLLINSNDPVNSGFVIPVSMDVTGVPELSINSDDIVFSNTLVGEVNTQTLNIRNSGTDLLTVDLAISGSEFSLEENALEIGANSSESLLISFEPASIGEKSAVLTLSTNDQNALSAEINLTALAVDVPDVSYDPSEINLDLSAGQTLTEIISVENLVNYDLDLRLEVSQNANRSSFYQRIEGEYNTVGKVEMPSFRKLDAPQIGKNDDDVSGGYEFIDTDNGLSYNWFDIQNQGTSVNLSDDSNSGSIPLGFNFEFFEQTFNTINIGSNGWLSFTNQSGSIWSTPLPSTNAPENVIAVMAADLYPGQGSTHYYFDQAQNRFIVQYTGYSYCCSDEDLFTMQAQIYSNGDIIILYDEVNTNAMGTVGIQNDDRSKGLTVAYNEEDRIVSGYGVKIFRGIDWISLPSSDLTVAASSSSDLAVDINTERLIAGTYSAEILVSELDFNTNLTSIPVTIEVSGASLFEVESDQIDFDEVIVNAERTIELIINNRGNDVLTVEMSSEEESISFGESSLSIDAFQSGVASITLSPTEVGNINSEIVFETNDPDNPEVVLGAIGKGVNPPTASVSKEEIVVVMEEGEEVSESFTISNAVNSATLNYNISIELESDENARSGTENIPLDFYAKGNESSAGVRDLDDFYFSASSIMLSNNSDIILDTLMNIPLNSTGAVNVNGKIYATNYSSGQLVRYNAQTEVIEETYEIHAQPYGITYDGNTLWIGQQESSAVRGYDLSGNAVGSFDLPFSSIFPALTFNGDYILASQALVETTFELYALRIDGTVANTYTIANSDSKIVSQILFDNDNFWLINFANEINELEQYAFDSGGIEFVENYSTGIAIEVYSLARYQNELLSLPFIELGYLLEDGLSGWLSADPRSGTVDGNSSAAIQLNFNSSGLGEGVHRAKVFVSSDDPNKSVIELSAILSIGNFPPEVVQEMEDISMMMNDTVMHQMDLNNYFTDDGTIDLQFEVESSSDSVVNMAMDGSMLTLTPAGIGEVEIMISAFDGELYGRTSFMLTVEEVLSLDNPFLDMQIFPNPTNGLISVKSNKLLEISIFDMQGRYVPVNVTKADTGYEVDLSSVVEGLYLIKVKNENNQEYSSKIIKN